MAGGNGNERALRVVLLAVLLLFLAGGGFAKEFFFVRGVEGVQNLTLVLIVTPQAPTIPSSSALGATVATLQGVWSDGSSFTGNYTFLSPNYDADTYTISGSNLIIATNGPGVGSDGGTVDQVTMEAVQIAPTVDGITSSAPGGAALATSAGIWSWGPIAAGRTIACGGSAADYIIYLNGSLAGCGLLIEVAHGGQLYANTTASGWFVWNGTRFVSSSAP